MNTIYSSPTGERLLREHYLDQLRRWPVSAEHLRVATDQGETFVLVCGPSDAPPVVLLHGSGANAGAWSGDIAALARTSRVYAVDLIGEPGLSAPSRPPLEGGAHAQWLVQVLDGLGLTEPAVVGMSLGGWMALDLATRRPDRVRRLGLLCPGGLGRQTMGKIVAALALRALGPWGRRRSVRAMTGLSAAEAVPMLEVLERTFAHFRPRTERLPAFSDQALGELTMPVLAVVGGRDAMFDSAGTAARLRAWVPHAQVRVLPEAGHALLGQGEELARFLAE
ncbi:pimeloyl-ACP methyl ester carboxylesterase [Nocardiopsis sp. Huas11]|uniref:alpha/beta fold hydrolase n=1 Tax=Nocardiopsis sp. Huas11 TaxID=2183912 RepID=UPI000EB055C2|nr:alpha/beta hydrolase [Nocardiopsis sp. Huas11]RKS08672.1 pimeloyl-ACP methyl ester carboxylesterase [Nocardiopsis sp. Huas11]